MGQSYSSLTDRNLGAVGSDITELPDLTYDKSLGSARFLKTIRARHADGTVVVKVFVKPTASFSLKEQLSKLEVERVALTDVPNAFPYQRIVETERAGYLIRQYLYSSLYDRISTRPFLEEIEKRWIAFQLLCGLRDSHARGVRHGDIKTENVMVTSWNWIYLSDFSSFKPAYLPEDNPADFTFFFDTSGRRTCYVAPERFVSTETEHALTDEMDVFSLGCVIAELFLEGTPLFSLSQLFKYRKGEYDPSSGLEKIEDPEIRSLIYHMINLNPSQRYSAEEYLNQWRRKAFPEYFYSFLHQYVGMITDPSSGRSAVSTNYDHTGEADGRIDRIYHDFDKISFFLGYAQSEETDSRMVPTNKQMIPVHLDIPNYRRDSPAVRRYPSTSDDGTLIFLTLVVSSIRNTTRATARVRACDILLALSERITDEAKLDRCLPYIVALLNDEADIVKVSAIRTITQLMALVETVSPVNAYVFPEYILPKLKPFITNSNPLVRATLASCLATLADSASRVLTLTQTLRAQGILPTADPEAEAGSAAESSYQALFDVSRNNLVTLFQEYATAFLTDNDSSVRRAILPCVSRLCVFFGRQKANDVILSHLNTYLNDPDWMLRGAFFETITGVAAFVGGVSLEEYIMPLVLPSLTDPEEFVVEKVLRSLSSMADLGLFQRSKMWELIEIISRFSMHPNLWIRQASVSFVASCVRWLAPSEIHCIILPIIRPYLRTEVLGVSELDLLEYLKAPLPRAVFDQAVSWALNTGKSNFWKGAQEQRTFTYGSGTDYFPNLPTYDIQISAFGQTQLNEDDQNWLSKLRNFGMTTEDEWKLTALREYIWRMARSKPRPSNIDSLNQLNNTFTLKDLDITPQTVFFDYSHNYLGMLEPVARDQIHSLADALIDASNTISDTNRRQNPRLIAKKIADKSSSRLQIPMGSANHSGASTPSTPRSATGVQVEGSYSSKISGPQSISNGDSSAGNGLLGPNKLAEGHRLRHKPSMISLLNKGKDSKAAAETATVSATATGTVEPPMSRAVSHEHMSIEVNDPGEYRFRTAYSYNGSDPHILQMLDSMFLENYPSDFHEFGPTIVPVTRRHPIKKSNGRPSGTTWRPEGSLVAQFSDHTGPINRVVVAPDHTFFITGSDDGTIKIWDTSRLEKNVATRARQTYKHNVRSKVKSLCFVENTHCFVSAASDGSVHIVRVECVAKPNATKYGKLKTLRTYQLPNGEYVVWMEHFKTDSNSILLMATNLSNIHALELRTMKILYSFKNPLHHGTPTCFCVDRRKIWLAVGTTHGIIDMYDLRFRIRVKAWGLPGSIAIHRIMLHPTKGRGKWITVAGGSGQGEVTVWDVEKVQCREVYRAGGGKDSGKGYEAWKVDEEKPEGILGRFATSPLLEPNASGVVDRGVRAITVAADTPEDSRDPKNGVGFMITAGADRKIRYWNLSHIENSVVISGMDVEEGKPTFTSSHPTPTLTLNTERVPQPAVTQSGPSTPGRGTSANSSSKKSRPSGRPPRSTVISMQQQQLLKSHLDSIQDVAVVEVPYGMCISVDRSGMILIFQ